MFISIHNLCSVLCYILLLHLAAITVSSLECDATSLASPSGWMGSTGPQLFSVLSKDVQSIEFSLVPD